MIYFIKNQKSQKHIKLSPFKVISTKLNKILYKKFMKLIKVKSRQNQRKKEKIRKRLII